MNNSGIVKIGITAFLFLIAQVLFGRNLVLFNQAFCFFYLGFILLLPLQIGHIRLMFMALLFGLILDVFYDSLGMHAAASVLIAFLRTYWLNLITPRGGYENVNMPSIPELSLGWAMVYGLPLLFIHHSTLFLLEAGGFHIFFYTLAKALASTFFSFVVIAFIQYLFYKRSRMI